MEENRIPPPGVGKNLIAQVDATGIPMLLARLILGLIFFEYGVDKIQDPVKFLQVLKTYEVLPLQPPELINSIAVSMPWIELLIGLAFLCGVGLRGAALAATGLLLIFTPAVWSLGESLVGTKPEFVSLCDVVADCGCGAGPLPICQKLMSNLGLLALSVWAVFSLSSRFRGSIFCAGGTCKEATTSDQETGS